jgi:hypothetical protein
VLIFSVLVFWNVVCMCNSKLKKNMKLQIRVSKIEEIEIAFPLSFKSKSGIYYHCFDENYSMAIYNSHFDNYPTSVVLQFYSPELECEKGDINEAFIFVVDQATNKMFGIPND